MNNFFNSFLVCCSLSISGAMAEQAPRQAEKTLATLYPIVKCSFLPSTYERVLLTKVRDKTSTTEVFRDSAEKLSDILVFKVFDCLTTKPVTIETPLTTCLGEVLDTKIDLVSILRSGDALLSVFMNHFPSARISKILIQRDEATAKPIFKYMKLSPTLPTGTTVIILDPMVATAGTMDMTIEKLKEKGVREENIVVACLVAAKEGLERLSKKYPSIRLVLIAFDGKLNERKYIVPGLGDFGDRYFNPS